MSDNIGKMILLFILIVLGIVVFVYIGIPIVSFVVLLGIKILWLIAAVLAEFVRIIVFVILLAAVLIGVYTFIKWLIEKKSFE